LVSGLTYHGGTMSERFAPVNRKILPVLPVFAAGLAAVRPAPAARPETFAAMSLAVLGRTTQSPSPGKVLQSRSGP
jgi:hypothetical protein